MTMYYPLAQTARQAALILNVPLHRLLSAAELPPWLADNEVRGATLGQHIALWNAMEALSDRPDLPLHLGRVLARIPVAPAMLALSCSRDMRRGLHRLAQYKCLIGPIRLAVSTQSDDLEVRPLLAEPVGQMPAWIGVLEIVFLLESCRTLTAARIVPKAIGLPASKWINRETVTFLGVQPVVSAVPFVTFGKEDSLRRFVSENEALWAYHEQSLRRDLDLQDSDDATVQRVRRTLVELLPAGEATLDAVCARFHQSKRTVQRRIQNEGETFQSILSKTRRDLALQYLSDDRLTISDVAFLVGYREPNSFYRAFKGWTGTKPQSSIIKSAAR